MSPQRLAQLLGLSDGTVRQLAREGTFVKAGRGQYVFVASLQRYIARLRDAAAGRGGEAASASLVSERARLAKEQAEGQAMKNAALRRELVPVVDVEREWVAVLRAVRSSILAVPQRVQQRLPNLTTHDVSEIDRELRAVLMALGEDHNSKIEGATR